MNPDDALIKGLDQFGGVLGGVTQEDWAVPTPCDQWTVRQLVGHVLRVTDNALASLTGKEYDWSASGEPQDGAGKDPAAAFAANAAQIRALVSSADLDAVNETPMGPMTVAQRISFPAVDLHVHAWDLGQATGVPVTLDPELITFAHSVLDPIPDEMKRSSGVFGDVVPVSSEATASDQFLGWTGRTPA